jgi:hypothetical protein
MECCGCPQETDYQEKLKKYNVTDLLNYKEIKEYVDSSIKLYKYRTRLQSLINDIHNLEKKISEIMESTDLIKDSEKKINDMTEFYCNSCKAHFAVPNDKCKISFDGEGGLEANVYKYYACPKCTKICWA